MRLLLVKTHNRYNLIKTPIGIDENTYEKLPLVVQQSALAWNVWILNNRELERHPFIQTPLCWN